MLVRTRCIALWSVSKVLGFDPLRSIIDDDGGFLFLLRASIWYFKTTFLDQVNHLALSGHF